MIALRKERLTGQEFSLFDLYCYQDIGYDVTRAMRKLAKQLFNYTPVAFDEPTDEIIRDIIWAGDVTGQRDDDMEANMERSSYRVLITPFGG